MHNAFSLPRARARWMGKVTGHLSQVAAMTLPLLFAYIALPPVAHAHPHHQSDTLHPMLTMTPEQQLAYQKTVASVLEFVDQFHGKGEDYVDALAKLKNALIFSYDHPYRTREFCNAFALCRDDYVGMKLKTMNAAQQVQFLNLMQTLLAPYGYQKMEKVFARQPVIFDMEQAYRDDPKKYPAEGGSPGSSLENWKPVDAKGNPTPRDPDDYYIAFFGDIERFANGTLTLNQGFGIRVEGHHLSLNFTFANKDNHLLVSTSPTFYGSNPMVVPPAPTSAPDKYRSWKLKVGDAFMLSETQLAKVFIQSLTPDERQTARYPHMGSPMFEAAGEQRPTESASYQDWMTRGLKVGDLRGNAVEQKHLLLEFLKLIAATQQGAFLNLKDLSEDMSNMRISFYGGLGQVDAFYFRIQSEKFLLELVQSSNFSIVNPGWDKGDNDPLNNGLYNNNHVHIMFRDLQNDWGYDPLFLHERQDHRAHIALPM